MFQSTNDAQRVVASKDKGLRPLLTWIENSMNLEVLPQVDDTDEFEFCFVGFDQTSDEQRADLHQKQVKSIKTVNEARAEEGLPPRDDCDIILDNTWLSAKTQAEQAEQQEEMQEGQGENSLAGEGGMDQDNPESSQGDDDGGKKWSDWMNEKEETPPEETGF